MTKGMLSRDGNSRQERIENALALLGTSLLRLEHDNLRVQQAINRTGLDDLLSPVIDDHRQVKLNLRHVQKLLREIWDDGQANRWNSA